MSGAGAAWQMDSFARRYPAFHANHLDWCHFGRLSGVDKHGRNAKIARRVNVDLKSSDLELAVSQVNVDERSAHYCKPKKLAQLRNQPHDGLNIFCFCLDASDVIC